MLFYIIYIHLLCIWHVLRSYSDWIAFFGYVDCSAALSFKVVLSESLPSGQVNISKISFFQWLVSFQASVRCQRPTMSRNCRRWEEPASSNWEPGYSGRAFYDDNSWRHYAPSTAPLPRRSFDYWREEALVAPTSYYPPRSYGRESSSYDEQWRDDSRPRQSSYPRRRRDFEPGRDWEDSESRRDRNLPYRNSSHHRYSTYAPAPYNPRSTFRARSPIESMPPISKPAPLSPPRKASLPPEAPKPSPGYLALSDEPSENLHDPGKIRKLLVLDLNGTLLIRSARSRASSGPQLRPVQPRPYMQSFRQYLFCADTKAWLDTMVWSSAQPHSVDDMVDKVFGATKGELKAVWNRKSLGLSEAEYREYCFPLSMPYTVFVRTSPLWSMELAFIHVP